MNDVTMIVEYLQGAFFDWYALKMTDSQPLKEFSELVLPKKTTKNEKSLSTRTGPTLQLGGGGLN